MPESHKNCKKKCNNKKCQKVQNLVKKLGFIVSVLLSAHAERVGVSSMLNFFYFCIKLYSRGHHIRGALINCSLSLILRFSLKLFTAQRLGCGKTGSSQSMDVTRSDECRSKKKIVWNKSRSNGELTSNESGPLLGNVLSNETKNIVWKQNLRLVG